MTAGWGIYFLNPGRIHAALNAGYRKAFIGTSDSHSRNPGLGGGLTGVYAEDLTDEKILEAYRDRRLFATTGSRVSIEARLNGVCMGRDVPVCGPVKLELRVDSPRPIKRTVLVRDCVEIKSFAGSGNRELHLQYEEVAVAGKPTWYYWRVELEGFGTNHPQPGAWLKAISRGLRRFGPCRPDCQKEEAGIRRTHSEARTGLSTKIASGVASAGSRFA